MTVDHNGPDAAYPGPAEKQPDLGEGHGSGLEQTNSEPKQGVGEAWSGNRPADWDPPPGDPGTGEGTLAPHDADETDDAASEEDMQDVDANNAVSSEHPDQR